MQQGTSETSPKMSASQSSRERLCMYPEKKLKGDPCHSLENMNRAKQIR